jgi:hypothetical protein
LLTRSYMHRTGLLSLLLMAAACAQPPDDSSATEAAATDVADDVFASEARFDLNIDAPVAKLIADHQRAREAHRPSPETDGSIVLADGRTIKMKLSVRGQSSAQPSECTFPKMKIVIDENADVRGTPFEGHPKLGINTHCGERAPNDKTPHGRIANELSPIREDLAYRLVRAIGVPTYRTRLAFIHWIDRQAGKTTPMHGLMLESTADAIERFQAEGVIPSGSEEQDVHGGVDPTFFVANAQGKKLLSAMDPRQILGVYFAEAIVGNFDWFFQTQGGPDKEGLRNIDVVGKADGPGAHVVPIPQDFDLTTTVNHSNPASQAIDINMSKVTASFPADLVSSTAADLMNRRNAVDAAITSWDSELAKAEPTHPAHVDPDGRERARQHVDLFFARLATMR